MCTETFARSGIRRWLVAVILLSLVGLADSSYLLWEHRTGGSARCPANGCDVVTQGEYAEIGGIPVAAFGLVGYLTLLVLSIMAAGFGGRSIVATIFAVSGIGVGVSAFLVYLQVAVIKAICFWCVLSAFTLASVFILSILLVRKKRPRNLSEAAVQGRAI